MTALLYYSISSSLTEDQIIEIDRQVSNNRKIFFYLVKKNNKIQRIIMPLFIFGNIAFFSNVRSSEAIMSPPLVKYQTNYKNSYEPYISPVSIVNSKLNKITFKEIDRINFDLPENCMSTADVDKIVKLRGGNLDPLARVLLKIILILTMSQSKMPTTGFKPGGLHSGFGHSGRPAPRIAPKVQRNQLNRNNPGQGGCRAKQNNNNHDGTLTKEQRRNLPTSSDVIIYEEDVIIRHGQAAYKMKKHGHDFGIEPTQDSEGRFRIEKTPENIEAFKKEIEKLVFEGERVEGTYRKGKPNAYEAIHFYDNTTKKNAIFKKETKEFVSAWKLNKEQVEDLESNQNVGDFNKTVGD